MKVSKSLPRTCRRTILRQLTVKDLPRFQNYRKDPEVARFQGWEQMTDKEAMSFIQYMNTADILLPGHWYQIGIADRSNGCLIGDIGVCVDAEEKEAELGFTLERSYQNRGLGGETVREAIELIFEHTRVERIVAITDELNLASVNLLKAVGMEQIGKSDTVFRDEPCTELRFSILRT